MFNYTYKQINFEFNKEIRCALQSIYGIGWYKSILICTKLGLSYPFRLIGLNFYNFLLLSFILEYFTWLEVRIKRFIYQNIKKQVDINTYKGLRHKDSLPVRGQRTRTNARTKKRFKFFFNE